VNLKAGVLVMLVAVFALGGYLLAWPSPASWRRRC